ncbi:MULTISPECIES: LysM domain-containing protein [unclassified Streptococcus]|uniref:LysM peptidoglycan-binding domain-containing protein n=1 Tax=unclassified Streptococcus TaxID=2608887 RepID=UPI001071FF99|nr:MULTISPECIES: LysM domain-containing protein [unclassified Streptococcus]MBF0805594.1 LysM peptidoglycan-binding domain-containing protein [Streptococcus sp. 19428wA2_WM07]TFU28892.1 LysM peptidoglycan-binding domain-containing protein [Streptococcus sp. WM07]
MKFNKKIILASSLLLSVFAGNNDTQATEQDGNWTPRTTEQIRDNLVRENDTLVYIVQYGDTLGQIAEAMGVDMAVLARLNQIENVNVIQPGMLLRVTVNANNQPLTFEVINPQVEGPASHVASVDLTTQEIYTQDQVIPMSQTVATIVEEDRGPTYMATQPPAVNPALEQASEVVNTNFVAASTDSEVPAAETSAVSTAPVVEASQTAPVVEAPVPAQSAPAPAVEAPAPAQSAPAPAVEAPAPAPVAETPAPVEQPVEEATQPAEELLADHEHDHSHDVVETPAQPVEQPVAEPSAPAQTVTPVDTSGLQPVAANFMQDIANQFGITDYSKFRAGDQDHGRGLAVDAMVYNDAALGNQVAQYAVDNINNANISYIIWQQRFYSPVNNIYGPANTWNLMPDRGSVTANHYDHVHVSFNG